MSAKVRGRPTLLEESQMEELRQFYFKQKRDGKKVSLDDLRRMAEEKYGAKYSKIGFYRRFYRRLN